MLAHASLVWNAPGAGLAHASMRSSLRAAVHSRISSTRKNGIANSTGSRIGGGSTSRKPTFTGYLSTTTPPDRKSIGTLCSPEVQHLVTPRRPHFPVQVIDHRIVAIDHQRGAVTRTVGPPFGFTRQPDRLARRGEVGPARAHPQRHGLA